MSSPLPALPKIEGDVDLILDVYTHRSLRMDTSLNDDYGDTDRLAELGAKILDLTVTSHFFSKKPMLTASQIVEKSRSAVNDEALRTWLESYGLRNKVRFAPGEDLKNSIDSPEEIRRFFNTYIGALHIRNGMSTIQDWISRLVDPDFESNPGHMTMSPTDLHQSWSNNSPSQPPSSPPPLPPNYPQSTSVGASSLVSLALVNQTAAQRGFLVTYPAEQTGPPHLPTWTVKCCMNGVEYGLGSGKSQKRAKEEAARQAWASLKW